MTYLRKPQRGKSLCERLEPYFDDDEKRIYTTYISDWEWHKEYHTTRNMSDYYGHESDILNGLHYFCLECAKKYGLE